MAGVKIFTRLSHSMLVASCLREENQMLSLLRQSFLVLETTNSILVRTIALGSQVFLSSVRYQVAAQ